MTVDADISSSLDLLGKVVTDLQENITFSGDTVSGTLKYVTGYTGFSGDVAEQSGNYLALHFEVPDVEGVTLSAELIGGVHPGPKTLDPDGIFLVRLQNTSEKIRITATKTGYGPVTKTYKLTGLTLESA